MTWFNYLVASRGGEGFRTGAAEGEDDEGGGKGHSPDSWGMFFCLDRMTVRVSPAFAEALCNSAQMFPCFNYM